MDIAAGSAAEFKEMSSPEEMTYVVESNGYKIKVVFMNISIDLLSEGESGIDYSAYVMVSVQR